MTLDNSNKQITSLVHIVREFVDVFSKDLPGLLLAKEVNFQIDLELETV